MESILFYGKHRIAIRFQIIISVESSLSAYNISLAEYDVTCHCYAFVLSVCLEN